MGLLLARISHRPISQTVRLKDLKGELCIMQQLCFTKLKERKNSMRSKNTPYKLYNSGKEDTLG
eukprot:1160390-Pelagomonas_calceolata.AAC.9